MAIARLSMKVGKRGKAGPHAAYIARIGQYARYLGRGEKLEATEAGNMPGWAQSNPLEFWQAADSHERENGTTYREMEIALPRELHREQRIALVRDWVRQEIGERHAYQWGIHNKAASDGSDQPHVHLMFSERQRDDMGRDPEQYFKRYNSAAPEKGGSRKGYGASAGRTLTKAQRALELKALRERWSDMCNAHLDQAGQVQRIDMRSYADQGVDIEPERKHIASEWRRQGKAKVIELRQARAELAEASQELVNLILNAEIEIRQQTWAASSQQGRERRGLTAREEASESAVMGGTREIVHQDHERLTYLRGELDRERLSLDIMAVGYAAKLGCEAHGELVKAKKVYERLVQRRNAITQAQEQWRESHPLMAIVGWKNREAWDLEYALEALPEQELVAKESLQTAERVWLAAREADTRAWRIENEARRQRIWALEVELKHLDVRPKPQRESMPERERPGRDDHDDNPVPGM